jgi:AraC-like DNA-binding protein
MLDYTKIKSDEPVVLYCLKEDDLPPGISYGPVIRDIFVFESCTAGAGTVIINGKEFPIKPRDCYILLPGDTVTQIADKVNPRQGIWCAVGGLAVGRYLKQAGITASTPFASPEVFDELYSCLERIHEAWESNETGANLKLTGYVYEFLSILFRSRKIQPTGDEWIEKSLGIIESRYNELTTVNELAEATGLERTYFSTLFKSNLRFSPHEYLMSFKLKKACSLLEDTSFPIGNVADMVGIPQENFARVFKKEYGITPLAYRKKNQNKKQS